MSLPSNMQLNDLSALKKGSLTHFKKAYNKVLHNKLEIHALKLTGYIFFSVRRIPTKLPGRYFCTCNISGIKIQPLSCADLTLWLLNLNFSRVLSGNLLTVNTYYYFCYLCKCIHTYVMVSVLEFYIIHSCNTVDTTVHIVLILLIGLIDIYSNFKTRYDSFQTLPVNVSAARHQYHSLPPQPRLHPSRPLQAPVPNIWM